MSGDYPYGLEYAWLASDSIQNIAVFITAGEGWLPSELLNTEITTDLEEEILKLPQVSNSSVFCPVYDFLEISKRGFFCV